MKTLHKAVLPGTPGLDEDKVGINELYPQQMLVVSNGKVGLGYNNSSQSATLAVNGDVGIGSDSPIEKSDVDGMLNMRDNIKLNEHWLTGDGENEGVYVKTTGEVGIGTSTPTDALDINGVLRMQGNIKLDDNWLSGDGGNEGVFVSSRGEVGIGTSTPTEQLEVNGNLKMGGNLMMGGNITLNSYWLSGDGGNEGIKVSSSGFVGINITPSHHLHVGGNAMVAGWVDVGSNLITDSDIKIDGGDIRDVNGTARVSFGSNLNLKDVSGVVQVSVSSAAVDCAAPIFNTSATTVTTPNSPVMSSVYHVVWDEGSGLLGVMSVAPTTNSVSDGETNPTDQLLAIIEQQESMIKEMHEKVSLLESRIAKLKGK